MARDNEGQGLGEILSSVGATLGLIVAWLYTAGWTYTHSYFDRFRIPLLMLDIPFEQTLVYGGLVILKNLWISALIVALFGVVLWSVSRWWRKLGRFFVTAIIVGEIVCGFALAHAGGIQAADNDFQAERHSDYEAYPRLRLLSKKEMADAQSDTFGDVATTDCARLVAATKDRLFLIRPSRDAPGADIDTYIISAKQVLAMRVTGEYGSCR